MLRYIKRVLNDKLKPRLAVLYDVDNFSISRIEEVLKIIDETGICVVKKAYYKKDSTPLKNIHHLKSMGFEMIENIYRWGNSADFMISIDSVILMGTKKYDGFCFITSDLDFIIAVDKIKEHKYLVYGFGHNPSSEFRHAFNKFYVFEKKKIPSKLVNTLTLNDEKELSSLIKSLYKRFRENSKDDWVQLSLVGKLLSEQHYDISKFGNKMSDILKSLEDVELSNDKSSFKLKENV